MKISEGKRCNEAQVRVVVLVGFTRKAHHDVCPDAAVGNLFVNRAEALSVLRGPVTTVHEAQDAVAAALQWDMEMLRQARLARHQADEFGADIHHLDGAETHPRDGGFSENPLQQPAQSEASVEVLSVAP